MAPLNKLLVKDDEGVPMVARVVDNVLASHARPVVVVTGHERERVETALAGRPVRFAHAEDYAEGLSASLKAGLATLPPDIDGVVVCLGDMPLVAGPMIDRLIAAFDPEEGRAIAMPTFRGKQGNPMLWSREFLPEMMAITGDVGARHLVGKHADRVVEVEMADDAVLKDFDTADALAKGAGLLGGGVTRASPGLAASAATARTHSAQASAARSCPKPVTTCTPSGRPFGPSPAGTVTQGTCSGVQSELKTGSPVQPSPCGASPGADGVSSASKGPMVSAKAARAAAKACRASSSVVGGCDRAQSIRSRSTGEICAEAWSSSQAERLRALHVHHGGMGLQRRLHHRTGVAAASTVAPALLAAAATRSSRARVSGAA